MHKGEGPEEGQDGGGGGGTKLLRPLHCSHVCADAMGIFSTENKSNKSNKSKENKSKLRLGEQNSAALLQ